MPFRLAHEAPHEAHLPAETHRAGAKRESQPGQFVIMVTLYVSRIFGHFSITSHSMQSPAITMPRIVTFD